MRVSLAVIAIAAYFCAMAWPGLHSGFSHDDLMNITFALRDGWSKVIAGNFLFFSTQYRPLGSVYYLTIFDIFGLNSLPFRIVGIALLAFNIWLLYRLTKRLTDSVEAGLYAALLIVWHGNFAPLFFGSGNIYDVLGFTFYLGALLFYASARQSGMLTSRQLAVLAVLQICALNSKEFSATIPVLVLAFELIFHVRSMEWRSIVVSGLLSGVYTAGKVFGRDSLTSHVSYRPRLSLDAYTQSLTMFLNDLTYATSWATPAVAAWFVVILVFVPILLRNRAMLFGAAIALLAPLPVMLIAPRGLASHYLTVGGLALWAGALIWHSRVWFSRTIRATRWEEQYLQTVAFVILFGTVLRVHATAIEFQTEQFWKEALPIAQSIESTRKHPEWFADPGRRILVVSDPFDNHEWATIFVGILVSGNPNVQIFRLPSMQPPPSAEELKKFGLYLRWEGNSFVETTVPPVKPPVTPL